MKKLKISSIADINKMWKEDFLGLKGFFCPGIQNLKMGEEVEIVLETSSGKVGKAVGKVVWQNFYSESTDLSPKGSFLKLMVIDDELKKVLV